MRSGRRWLVALGGLTLAAGVGAVALFLASSSLTVQTDLYYSSFDYTGSPVAVEIDPEEDAYYNGLSQLSSTFDVVGRTLLTAAVAAAFILLAVLAYRRTERASV